MKKHNNSVIIISEVKLMPKLESEQNDGQKTNQARIVEMIKDSFKNNNKPPQTSFKYYKIGKVIAKGKFGKVRVGLHKLSNKLVVLKLFEKQKLFSEISKEKVRQEAIIHKRFRHPNIVKLYETFESEKHAVLAMELWTGGNLYSYVRKRKRLNEEHAKYIFKQIIEGVSHMHQRGVVHRDIKQSNILLDGKGVVKIWDFGISRIITNANDKMTNQCGTPAYIAPEILTGKGYYGFACDIWSVGVVLYLMLYGIYPFRATNTINLIESIIKGIYTLSDDISEESRDLIKNWFEIDPKLRFTIPQILAHPWMQDIKPEIELFDDQELQHIKNEFTFSKANKQNSNIEPRKINWDPLMSDTLDSMKLKLFNTITFHFPDIPCKNQNSYINEVESDWFSEKRLDSISNNSTNSVILAPFNSSITSYSSPSHDSLDEFMVEKCDIITIGHKLKSIEYRYESNSATDNVNFTKFEKI